VLGNRVELGGRRAPRPQGRVDGQHLVVRQGCQLGGALEVLGQLLAARSPGDGCLPQQRLRRRAQVVGRDATGAQRCERDLRERRARVRRDELGPPFAERVVVQRIRVAHRAVSAAGIRMRSMA
jgi:hypothetical protein